MQEIFLTIHWLVDNFWSTSTCIDITLHGSKYNGDRGFLWSFPNILPKLGMKSLSREEEPLLVLQLQQLAAESTIYWIFADLGRKDHWMQIDQKENGT